MLCANRKHPKNETYKEKQSNGENSQSNDIYKVLKLNKKTQLPTENTIPSTNILQKS